MPVTSIDLASDSMLERVAKAVEAGNTITAASLAADGSTAIYDAFFAAAINEDNIDSMFVSWWNGANVGGVTRTQLLNRWFSMLNDDKIFGVKFPKFVTSQSSDGELIEYSATLGVCTPSTNTVKGKDPYCKLPAFWTKEINYEIDSNGEIDVKAVQGVDSTFNRSGSAGMVGVAQKTGWCQYVDDGSYIYKRYTSTQQSGFYPLPEGVKPDGTTIRPFVVHAKYMAGVGSDGKLTSATHLAPANYTYSHNSQIAEWRKRSANCAGISICDLYFRLFMFQLKYAKKGNSGTLEGCTNYNYQYKAAVSETGVTRILLTPAQAANLLVGSNVIIGDVGTGTSTGRSVASMYSKAKNKRIIGINSIVVDGTTYSAVAIETDTPFDTEANKTYISTMPWWSGSCDSVLGLDGSPTNNTNGKEPFIIQGLESQTGAYVIAADAIYNNVRTDVGDRTVWTGEVSVCRRAENIATSITSNYVKSSSICTIDPAPTGYAWHYIQDMGFDPKLPEMLNPSAVDGGASSSNGYRAALSVPAGAGSCEWLFWGRLRYGGSCGLGCSAVNDGLGGAYWDFAAGASGSAGTRGEWKG